MKRHTLSEMKGEQVPTRRRHMNQLNRQLEHIETAVDPAWIAHCRRVYLKLLPIVHRKGVKGSLLEETV